MVKPIYVKFIHWKIRWGFNEEFIKKGFRTIPCKNCFLPFKSYVHFGAHSDYCYDLYCNKCEKEMRKKKCPVRCSL